ncbi:tetratricopeptide repeat protein [Piscibacillus salipiscarius]|uniref:tetratricopeptide repeat protein n=1 Tax=Piscibacillus salipiscarius TaxID=299480 RepID=UPI002436758E|nr:tetratricopeptide repeat protein [Piscibacillus salipiscarius]
MREKIDEMELLDEVIAQVRRELLKTENPDHLCFLYGTLGNLYRLKNEPQQAIKCLEKALTLADADSSREIVMLIRLGEAYKYKHEHQKALEQFDLAILKGFEYEPQYLDFAYQHKGKCLMELGLYQEAMEAFQNAHAVRKGKKDERLLKSTEKAIEFLERLT